MHIYITHTHTCLHIDICKYIHAHVRTYIGGASIKRAFQRGGNIWERNIAFRRCFFFFCYHLLKAALHDTSHMYHIYISTHPITAMTLPPRLNKPGRGRLQYLNVQGRTNVRKMPALVVSPVVHFPALCIRRVMSMSRGQRASGSALFGVRFHRKTGKVDTGTSHAPDDLFASLLVCAPLSAAQAPKMARESYSHWGS
jgi:hypothetical protein